MSRKKGNALDIGSPIEDFTRRSLVQRGSGTSRKVKKKIDEFTYKSSLNDDILS